jgi:hypothetical protein
MKTNPNKISNRYANGVSGLEAPPAQQPNLISRRVAPKIVGLPMTVFCHKRTLSSAQRTLLGFDVFRAPRSPRRNDD